MANDEISVSVVVGLAGGGSMELEDPDNGYEVVSFGPGGRSWNRDVVEGTYVHGRTLLNATLATRTAPLVVRIHGNNWVQVRTRANALIEALSQRAYLITSTIEGAVETYVCEPADSALAGGDEWNKFELMQDQQTYVFTIPYDPVKETL